MIALNLLKVYTFTMRLVTHIVIGYAFYASHGASHGFFGIRSRLLFPWTTTGRHRLV